MTWEKCCFFFLIRFFYIYTLFQVVQEIKTCPETARISEGHSIKSCSWFSIEKRTIQTCRERIWQIHLSFVKQSKQLKKQQAKLLKNIQGTYNVNNLWGSHWSRIYWLWYGKTVNIWKHEFLQYLVEYQ